MAALTASVMQSFAEDVDGYRSALRDWLAAHKEQLAESTISWLSRYSQPLRRLPMGLTATRDALTRRAGRRGLEGLFSGPTA